MFAIYYLYGPRAGEGEDSDGNNGEASRGEPQRRRRAAVSLERP